MKKCDRIKPKKKRLYRIDHDKAMRRCFEKMNEPLQKCVELIRSRLTN